MLPVFEFEGVKVEGGQREVVTLPIGRSLTGVDFGLPVHIIQGETEGPVLLLTGAIHGNELNGVEVIRRLLGEKVLESLRGTVLAIPVVNTPAFGVRSRYLPDRRDLNRLFPGSESGSVGGRIARALTDKLVSAADAVIDFHTGALNRPNLPQLRITKGDEEGLRLARAFAAPLTLFASEREGSFRTECGKAGKPCLLFEGGEAMRLDAASIRFGLRGVMRVMAELEMLPPEAGSSLAMETVVSPRSGWVRSPWGGLFTPLKALGDAVQEGDEIGYVAEVSGLRQEAVIATRSGVVIGRTHAGVADEGDALFHLAEVESLEEAAKQISQEGELVAKTWRGVDDTPV